MVTQIFIANINDVIKKIYRLSFKIKFLFVINIIININEKTIPSDLIQIIKFAIRIIDIIFLKFFILDKDTKIFVEFINREKIIISFNPENFS